MTTQNGSGPRERPERNRRQPKVAWLSVAMTAMFFLLILGAEYGIHLSALFHTTSIALTAALHAAFLSSMFFIGPHLTGRICDRRAATLRDRLIAMQTVIDTVFDGIIVMNDRGIVEDVNASIERMFGLSAVQIVGHNINILMPEPDRSAHDGYVGQYIDTGRRKIIGIDRELNALHADGTIFPIELAVTEMTRDGERKFVGVLRDISRRRQVERNLKQANELLEQRVAQRTQELSAEIEERARAEEALHKLAICDPLSKICNRREFDRLFAVEFEQAQRYACPLSLIMFDIDFFKGINDRYGHMAGDAVIVELADLVTQLKRQSDVLARWGGDEFTILVPGVQRADACLFAEKLRLAIAQHHFAGAGKITCSFGVVGNENNRSPGELMKNVDIQLYRAKENGRNRVEAG